MKRNLAVRHSVQIGSELVQVPQRIGSDNIKWPATQFHLLLMTEKFADDLGKYFLSLKKVDRPFLWPVCVPLKNTLGWSAVVFCACEVTQSLSKVTHVHTAVHKYDFKLPKKETHAKWRSVERKSCKSWRFTSTVIVNIKGIYPPHPSTQPLTEMSIRNIS